jgi:acetyl-CoA C-acetyltransferase
MKNIAIVGAVRTPIGNYGGSLKNIPAYDLAALVLNNLIKRVNITPKEIDTVIMGQNYQSGEYVNIARMSLLKAGWPDKIPALTMDRRCCSGFDAIALGSMEIKSENADVVVAGGVESMSTAEFYLPGEIKWGIGGKSGMPRGHGDLSIWGIPLYDRIQRARVMSQPEERYGILPTMMTWAETAAKEYGISREKADMWALRSNQRACSAINDGKFKEEIVSVPILQNKSRSILFERDEHPRFDTNLEALSKLKPVLNGVCTAGNSSGENDGAAACMLSSEEKAKELGQKPLGYLKSFAMSATDPTKAWRSLSIAAKKALEKAKITLDQVDLIEIHEAFASQVLANLKELNLDEDDERINVNGSCIALGHPVGCTGARILTTLLYEMMRRNRRYGLLAICGGGGNGVCGIVERE